MSDKFKFKTIIYNNNEYILVQDLKIVDLHYNSELNIANNMMHEMNDKIKVLERENEKLEESVGEWKKACTLGISRIKRELSEEKRKHEETKKQLTVHRDMYHSAMRNR